MKSYCPNCGAATEYSGPKPKFCSSCGNPFSALAKKENKNYKIHEDVEIEDSEEEELENINFYNINKLDVEIIQEQSNSVTLGQIMETSAETEGDIQMSDINQNPPQQNSEDFIQEFQQEAGTLRQKDA